MELLDPVEARVLGCLIEKESTTPEYYPLSLNALINACNQKSNRSPVVDYDEELVKDAVERLRRVVLCRGGGRGRRRSRGGRHGTGRSHFRSGRSWGTECRDRDRGSDDAGIGTHGRHTWWCRLE